MNNGAQRILLRRLPGGVLGSGHGIVLRVNNLRAVVDIQRALIFRVDAHARDVGRIVVGVVVEGVAQRARGLQRHRRGRGGLRRRIHAGGVQRILGRRVNEAVAGNDRRGQEVGIQRRRAGTTRLVLQPIGGDHAETAHTRHGEKGLVGALGISSDRRGAAHRNGAGERDITAAGREIRRVLCPVQ